MGQKLESFLRVLGSGLSSQAFQANVGLYQQEQAERRQIEGEGRARTQRIEDINVTQTFKNLAPLGLALRKARAAGDTAAIQKISAQAKEIAEQNLEFAGTIKNTFMAYAMEPEGEIKPTTELTKLQKQRGRLEGLPQTEVTKRDIANINSRIAKITTITGTTEHDPRSIQKKTRSKIEDTLVKTGDNLARLEEIKRTYKENFLTYKTRFGEWTKAIKEQIGFKLDKADRLKLGEFAKFRRKTFSFLNEYIHDMSGAAVSVQEAIRMKKALPTMDDSPTEYLAKMEDLMSELESKQTRYEYWAKNGLINEKTDDRAIRSLESEFPEEAFAGINKAREAIASSQDPDAREKALARLRPWFEKNGYDPRILESL